MFMGTSVGVEKTELNWVRRREALDLGSVWGFPLVSFRTEHVVVSFFLDLIYCQKSLLSFSSLILSIKEALALRHSDWHSFLMVWYLAKTLGELDFWIFLCHLSFFLHNLLTWSVIQGWRFDPFVVRVWTCSWRRIERFFLMQCHKDSTVSVVLCFVRKDLLKKFASLWRFVLSLFFQFQVVLFACLMCFGVSVEWTEMIECAESPGMSEHLDVMEGQLVRKMSRRLPYLVGAFTCCSW